MAALLQFEHIIQINDPADPGIPPLSREALWQGLVFRVRNPGHFIPGLECRIEPGEVPATGQGFVRYLKAGEMELRDAVTLLPEQEIRTFIDGRQQPIHAESITRIEAPAPGHLIVRFIYCRDSISTQGGLDADEFLKEAYLQQDREAVMMIREMINNGWPDTLT